MEKRKEMPIKIVLYGIGQVMAHITRFLLEKQGVEIVGAIDIDPTKEGRDVGEVTGVGRLGVTISKDVDTVLSQCEPSLVLHATRSYFEEVYPEIIKVAEYGVNVISTAEQLAYPYIVDPSLAQKLDAMAKAKGATVLGTGAAPGFFNDTLPLVLTGMCQKIENITITGRLDGSRMREGFQRKIGFGKTKKEFEEAVAKKSITLHVGNDISIALLAAALKLELDKIEELPPQPITAKTFTETEYIKVEPGHVAGAKQCCRGTKGGQEVITIELEVGIGFKEAYYQEIVIKGEPTNVRVSMSTYGVEGPWRGEWGTAAVIVNSIPRVLSAPPGLVTMKDLPLFSATCENLGEYLK